MNRFHNTRQIRRGTLAPHANSTQKLRRIIAEAESCPQSDDLERLLDSVGVLEALTEANAAVRLRGLPAAQGEIRILSLARALLDGGEWRPSEAELVEKLKKLDDVHGLEMAELLHFPTALRIAIAESALHVGREIVRQGQVRSLAERWRRGKRCPKHEKERAIFWAHAICRCVEQEKAALREEIEERLNREGRRSEWLLEQAQRLCAENAMRLANLTALAHSLNGVDWQKIYERLSIAETELRSDAVYAGMDAESRAAVRNEAAELAKRFSMPEASLIRHAQRLAKAHQTTVCAYLYTDLGRVQLRKSLAMRVYMRRCVPDPQGKRTVAGLLLLTGLALVAFAWALDEKILFIYALPLCWAAVMALVGRFYSFFVKPRRLLKMKIDHVSDDARTLVVLPVLLSSPSRVAEMLARIESLGCLERDENIDYLLLGDFKDGNNAEEADDAAILHAARAGIAALNRRAERKKYYYLHRKRSYREKDGRWMGKNRKRGALTSLNRLLLGLPEAGFDAENADAAALSGRYRYVATLDADTQYLPEELRKLIGAMEHPLNQYAVLQPAMKTTARACVNEYVQTVYSQGGYESYPVTVSDFYQDICGKGCFAGKGIYDIKVFYHGTLGRLQDDYILSHDLIEGILAGAGFANDVSFYDDCPDNLAADLCREHRWTRGDWQLLPVIFEHGLAALDRMKMLGNLLRSLYAPCLLGLLIHALWLDAPNAFALGLLLAFWTALLRPCDKKAWKRALLELSLLPAKAKNMLDAILRTLWRLTVSKKWLMEWVPSADTRSEGKAASVSGRIAAILLLPALLRPFWIPAVLALGGLFFVGADWAEDLRRQKLGRIAPLTQEQTALLQELAMRTWRFFECTVPASGNGLPPDNLQMDPPLGAAKRTSPTNIGLYLLSCIAAQRLGLIGEKECLERMERTVQTLERMEKWQGQLYNWYDPHSLEALRPRYVSAVDSGNLAACLLLCTQIVTDEALSKRLKNLAQGMELSALYDEKRELFCIGWDAENGRRSQSHYDLYASESRILSYAAMMLGQAPVRHWQRLSRPGRRVGREMALLSWSGTLFEYLMPEIFFGCGKSGANSLAHQCAQTAIACQKRYGREKARPWGVSESGYYAFDLQLNYQYRAFGMRSLALSGEVSQNVVAPYASVLALCCDPQGAAKNIERMTRLGWWDEFGLFEAVDYSHPDGQGEARLVKRHMAHHQGMILCAVCNALCAGYLSEEFLSIPQANALSLLLQEPKMKLLRRKNGRISQNFFENRRHTEALPARKLLQETYTQTQLLHGAATTAMVRGDGAVFAWSGEVQANRFGGDLCNPNEGMFIHLRSVKTGETTVLGRRSGLIFEGGIVRSQTNWQNLQVEMAVCVSPEDGTLYQCLALGNRSQEEVEVEITGCFAVALAKRKDMLAHQTFQNLFVEAQKSEYGLIFHRKSMSGEDQPLRMVYLAPQGERFVCECDLERLIGRSGSLSENISPNFSDTAGNALNPCAALRFTLRLQAGQKKKLHFALLMGEIDEQRMKHCRENASAQRALQLAGAHAHAILRFAGVNGRQYGVLQRASAFLMDGGLKNRVGQAEKADRRRLWRFGISGDLPILLLRLRTERELEQARALIEAHGFYRMMGVICDIVFICTGENDYQRPLRSGLETLISASQLCGRRNENGGVFIVEDNAEEADLNMLMRAASLCLDGGEDVYQALRQMKCVEKAAVVPEDYSPMQLESVQAPPLHGFNSYGGFDGKAYVIHLRQGILPPAPWSNILATECFGALMTERGGGFAWHKNSRSGRITPFANDTLREGWGWSLLLVDDDRRSFVRLLPTETPMTEYLVRFEGGRCSYSGSAGEMDFTSEFTVSDDGLQMKIQVKNRGLRRRLRLICCADFLMGTDADDRKMLRLWSKGGACFAAGTAESVGLLAANAYDARARDGKVALTLDLKAGEQCERAFLLGAAENAAEAEALARRFMDGCFREQSAQDFGEMLEKLQIQTPDEGINRMANGFLQAQILYGRILGRTGLYQPGGAYGFRDQLQDMLPMLHYQPERVREHILRCAARQFPEGDVLHWWHEPYSGVRTKISDDLLFLPYVTAKYVQITGDSGILNEEIPFLESVPIPEGREDLYAEMRPSQQSERLHGHCMRAFHRAAQTGEHGLCLMGGGDWNDGMNHVGAEGRGESLWLSEFLAVCAENYAQIAPDASDCEWLTALNGRLCKAIERHGWDGEWYLRAYADDGSVLGGKSCEQCRIDAISQAWAVYAGLDTERTKTAMNALWRQLADEKLGVIRLLTPPFEGKMREIGYISAYPAGVRENGAQYTHAACWVACAWAKLGDSRAHRAIQMLLPVNHADTKEKADVYRTEPYVLAADVYTDGRYAGRGGWTWYTGAASWLLTAILELLGYERCGNRVRMNSLLCDWNSTSVELCFGNSRYRLICRREAKAVSLDGAIMEDDFIEMRDDGKNHEAIFPPREKIT